MSFALSTRDALDDILADARRDSVEFPYLLANHVPMVLVALSRLGASDARVAEYLANYRRVKGLVPIPPRVAPIERARWTEALGDRSREADYRDFFVAEVRRLGVNDAIATYLPTLLPGIGASALHGLMRLAYGVLRMAPRRSPTIRPPSSPSPPPSRACTISNPRRTCSGTRSARPAPNRASRRWSICSPSSRTA